MKISEIEDDVIAIARIIFASTMGAVVFLGGIAAVKFLLGYILS